MLIWFPSTFRRGTKIVGGKSVNRANISSRIGAKSFKLQCFCWVVVGFRLRGRFLSFCPWVSFCRGTQVQLLTRGSIHGLGLSALFCNYVISRNMHVNKSSYLITFKVWCFIKTLPLVLIHLNKYESPFRWSLRYALPLFKHQHLESSIIDSK